LQDIPKTIRRIDEATDPDGHIITYGVSCVTHKNDVILDNDDVVKLLPSFDLDNVGTSQATISCDLNAQDSFGLEATASLIILINDVNDNTPAFNSSNYMIVVRKGTHNCCRFQTVIFVFNLSMHKSFCRTDGGF